MPYDVPSAGASGAGGGLSESEVDARISALRPQSSSELTISGSGDSLTASPTWAGASMLSADAAALAGNCVCDVAGLSDGSVGKLRVTPANTKTFTLSTSTGTLVMQGGADLNPITGDGTKTWTIHVSRAGNVYDATIVEIGAFS